MLRRALSALMALMLLAGQMEMAAAYLAEPSDSQQEPPSQSAQIQAEPADAVPEADPTEEPSPADESGEEPTEVPTDEPGEDPTEVPTDEPSEDPTEPPSDEPDGEPTETPAVEPDEEPAPTPTDGPAQEPTEAPTQASPEAPEPAPETPPTQQPTQAPTEEKEAAPPTEDPEQAAPSEAAETAEQVIVAQMEESPEQDLLPEEDAVTITLSGELPQDAQVLAANAEEEAGEAGLDNILCAYDITINDGWQPEEAVEVSIASEALSDTVQVFHIPEDGEPEEVEITRSESGEVVFQAEGFSIYAVTENLFRRTYEFMDYKYGQYQRYNFLPDDPDHPEKVVNRQIIRNGDRLVVPSLPNKDGMRFLGWYTSPTAPVNTISPERGGIKNDITSNSIVILYARYGWPAAITYYTRPQENRVNQVFTTQIIYLPSQNGSMEVDLTDQLRPEPPGADQGFLGWRVKDAPAGELVDMEHFTLTGDVTLYPVFAQLYEITFAAADDNGAYIAPLSVGQDGCTGQLTDYTPCREGYAFNGWAIGNTALTDANGFLLDSENLVFPGGTLTGGVLKLDTDITLHSLWIPQNVEYRVIFWQEKTSDVKKLTWSNGAWSVPEAQKEYDFLGTLRLTALTGTSFSREELDALYAGLSGTVFQMEEYPADFTGLVFNDLRDKDGVSLTGYTVSGDNTNIVHVFYDRALVTYRFHFPEDITSAVTVDQPSYTPALPESGTVTQKGVSAIASVDYPQDYELVGLYGCSIADGMTESGQTPQWPVSYTAEGLSYTVTTRTMRCSNNAWQQTSVSSSSVNEDSRTFFTRWVRQDGSVASFQETFGLSDVLTPTHTLDTLSVTSSSSTVSCYKENEQSAYPADPVYSSTPALTFTALNGETVAAENPFSGYTLDYFTYTDSRGTPIRRDSTASLEQRTLVGGTFTNLKIYCKRNIHYIQFHNGSSMEQGPGVKYGMGLSTDYVKQALPTPALPGELANQADELEFAGWFLDQECTIYLDFVGLKAGGRNRLMLQYDQIQMIVSVYDFRPAGGSVVPGLKMGDADLHLFAGWVHRRVLVELEPDGGELGPETYTFFWKNYGDTLSVFPVSRNYVPADAGPNTFLYHIHTYDQSLLDNNTSDRSARYIAAGDGDSGQRYARQENSYRFLGWFLVETNPNGSEALRPYDHQSPLTDPVKLRAQWSRLGVYRLIYDPGEHGTIPDSNSSASYRDHASIALSGDVTAEDGYVFLGWRVRRPHTTDQLLDTLYSSGDELVLNADWAETVIDEYTGEPDGVITLVAQYAPLRLTSITYYVNGGTFVGPSEETQQMDPELVEQLKRKLIRDYGSNAYHQYIYDEDGTIIGYSVSGIEQNANLTTEDGTWFQRSGYKLMGWSSSATGSVELELHSGGFNAADDPDGAGFVLYAVWKPEMQVTFDLQGGNWNSANGPEYRLENGNWIYGAGNGEQAPVPKPPSKAGYAFAGWARTTSAKSGLQTMPNVTSSFTLYAVWTTNVILRFDANGGAWESVPKGLIRLDPTCYGANVTPGSSYAIPDASPVRGSGYLFHKWEQGAYQYSPGESFRTSAEQTGQTITLTAIWSAGVPAVDVLIDTADGVSVDSVETLIGATEDGSAPVAPGEIDGYQFLFVVYDAVPEEKADIAEHYRVTAIRRLSDDSYQVTLANGQTKIHYPDSVEKLQAIYIQNRPVNVYLKRMNVFEDGMDNMNITLTPVYSGTYMQLDVGKVDIQKALPKPKEYAKVGSTQYRSFTYAIGREISENMYAIDTMTQTKLWITQTLNGFAFSVNGEEWKPLDREAGNGKDVSVYIIYDNRVETPTTINHTVYGLKSDKEKLFTYQVYVKGRWGFNIGTGSYFLHKPDDPSEKLNSYTVALKDKEKVLIPLHIDYLSGQKQVYKPGDLFYDMFGADNPTTITSQSELRIWQEVEMRRTNELPFSNGTFETSIQMRSLSSSNHSLFNGYDKENYLWLKQLGISKYSTNSFSHSFIYKRTSLDVPIHVLELTRNGYELRDDSWFRSQAQGANVLSVTADNLTVGQALADQLVNAPEDYALQSVHYGLSLDSQEGSDTELNLRLAAETNDPTLLHVYDYTDAAATTRSVVPDGSEVYLVYSRHSSSDVPVKYVMQDASGAYTPVDLSGYNLTTPTIRVTDTEAVDFRSHEDVLTVNRGVEKLDAIYLTGRIFLADESDSLLATYQPGPNGDWDSGRAVVLRNSSAGVIYTADDETQQIGGEVSVWVEVDYNIPLRIVGRLWQRGTRETNTNVIPYLPKDGSGRIVADGTFEAVGEFYSPFQLFIPYATSGTADYISASIGNNGSIYSAAYCTDTDGYRYWVYRQTETSAPVSVSKIIYADYASLYSPVNIRYVVPAALHYEDAADLEPVVVRSVDVYRSGTMLSDALSESLETIDRESKLYRVAGTFALGDSALRTVYFTTDTSQIRLTDSMQGLLYETADTSGSLTDVSYPDVYVILQPIVTLTVSARTDNSGGYARFDDSFTISITLSDTSISGPMAASYSWNESLANAIPISADPGLVFFENGKAEVILKHGQSVSIPGLPRNIQATVAEPSHPAYYSVYYQVVQGAKATEGSSVRLTRHSTLEVINTSYEIIATGSDISDTSAYGFLLAGALAYGCYLLLKRRKRQ